MPNKPAEGTVSVSFTLPRILSEKVEERAKIEMTNKSDIIRRALMNYLTEAERVMVLQEIAVAKNKSMPKPQDVYYRRTGRKKGGESR
jgi:hypothetical protein